MRYKLFLLALIAVVACGAGPFRGRFQGSVLYPGTTGVQGNVLYPSVMGPGSGVINPAQNGELADRPQENAQINFLGVDGMNVNWDTVVVGGFDSDPLVCPGMQNFEMGKAYRLKLSNIPNRPGLVLYPTLEINSVTPRTRAYLDHNAIPIIFSDNDFDQVKSGNFVTKVIFLPSPEFQNLAVTGGVTEITNTQLPAGQDPVAEAQHRGAILAVVKIGNKDLSLPGSMPAAGAAAGDPRSVPQIPISGVNVPAYGTPNTLTPYGVPGPPVLPAATYAPARERLLSPINPMPATDIPDVSRDWPGNNF